MKNFLLGLNDSLQKNKWLYFLTTLFLCIGFVLGIYTVYYMGQGMKENLASYLDVFIDTLKDKPINYGFLIFQSFKNNALIFLSIVTLGFISIGGPFILILLLIKGYAIGFTFSLISIALGGKGIGLSLSGLMPQNLIFIPCLIVISSLSLGMSVVKLKSKFGDACNLKDSLSKSLKTVTIIFCLVFIGIIIESCLSPSILRYIITKF